ncbi:Crp/Fnr family transcriptional regulator [Actinocorallia longicatena]|uniref:HTH crp-type domain-containing protein n=1 Tax=Actinocorallia longicatena TaxID=111803 RepID=A0ABP6QE99_9ACTN
MGDVRGLVSRLTELAEVRAFGDGELLRHADDRVPAVVGLVSGRVKIVGEHYGRRPSLAFRDGPDLLGQIVNIGLETRRETISAVGVCSALWVPTETFLTRTRELGLEGVVHQVWASRRAYEDLLLAEMEGLPPEARVARLLWRIASADPAAHPGMTLPVGRSDLARTTGLGRLAASRQVAALRGQGVIASVQGRIVLVRPWALGQGAPPQAWR